MPLSVDEWVSTKVLPEHQETVAMLRALVRECAPQAEEVISYNMPVFKSGGHIFAWILGTKEDVTFSFRAGTSLEDRYGVLRGTGKTARHIKLKRVDSVDNAVLRYYTERALALETA